MRGRITRRPAARIPKQGKPVEEFGWLYGSGVFTFAPTSGAPQVDSVSFFDRNKRATDPVLGKLGPIWSNMPGDGQLPVGYQFTSSHLVLEVVDMSGAARDPFVFNGIKAELLDKSGLTFNQETTTLEYGPASRYPAPGYRASTGLGPLASSAQAAVSLVTATGAVRDATPFKKLIRSGGAFSMELDASLSTDSDRADMAVAVRAAMWGRWEIRRSRNAS